MPSRCSAGPDVDPPIDGSLTIASPGDVQVTGSSCRGAGGYSDIQEGSQVTVEDAAGKLIAISTLRAGSGLLACVFPFSVVKVPNVAFYKVAVGRRGAVSYSADELRTSSWHVDLTLG